jgi:hypothetical protein
VVDAAVRPSVHTTRGRFFTPRASDNGGSIDVDVFAGPLMPDDRGLSRSMPSGDVRRSRRRSFDAQAD